MISINPSFFIHNVRSSELKKRLLDLTVMREAILHSEREPVTKRTRITGKYQHLLDDYHTLIKEFNETRQVQALMMELIIMLAYHLDRASLPEVTDEIFSIINKQRGET